MQQTKNKAFTLVELIVVITILAILWTIAFISLQWYSRDARDSVRLTDLKNIETGLEIFLTTSWTLPLPDDYVELTAGSEIIWYQWVAWERTLNIAKVSNWWKDPLDDTYYVYRTNDNKTEYQLMWFFEDGTEIVGAPWIVKTSYAAWLENRYLKSIWSELWIILTSTNTSIHEVSSIISAWKLDISATTDSYRAHINTNRIIEWTWSTLFSEVYNSNRSLLTDKYLATLDESLVAYYDMETTWLTWPVFARGSKIWDITINSYDHSYTWATIWWEIWLDWKATHFTWVNDYLPTFTWQSSISNDFSFAVTFKYNSLSSTFFNALLQENDFVQLWVDPSWNINFNYLTWSTDEWWVTWPLVEIWEFYSAVATYDGDSMKLYFEGALVWENTNPNVYTISNDIRLAGYYRTIWPAPLRDKKSDVIIDDLRIYNKALSANEVRWLYRKVNR